MKNILVSLKNLVSAKKENESQPAAAPEVPPASESASDPEPEDQSENLKSPNRRLTGKVAGLPHHIRTQVNQWLYDGVTYKKICVKLEQLGYPGFVHQYIQRWKDNGYKHWLRAQERLEEAQREDETAACLAERPRCAANLAEANEIKLALRTSRLLDKVDEWDDEEALGEKSKAFFQLSRSVTSQLAERTRRERFKLDHDLKTRKQEISEEGKRKVFDLTAPLSKEQRDAILDKIDELLGIRLDPQDAPPSSPSPRWGEGRGEVSPSSSSSSSSSSAPPAPSDSCSSASISGSTLPPSEMHSHALPCRVEKNPPTSETSTPSPLGGASVPASRNSEVGRDVPIAPPPPPPYPVPDSTDSDLLHASRITHHASASSPAISPLSPLAGSSSIPPQPHDQVPVFDRYGAWIEWIPQEGPDSYPKFPNPIGFENRRKETICWINPKDPYPNTAPSPENRVCVINCQGRILYWLNKSSLDPTQPFYDAEPLRCRSWNTVAAWLAGWKESYVDPPCGALVG